MAVEPAAIQSLIDKVDVVLARITDPTTIKDLLLEIRQGLTELKREASE
jgi:hypothetical protein